jgi:glycosyltransferase involved in cell wall biosynthesis
MKKILFLSPLPPPHYGSAMSSEICLDILNNSKKFEVKNIRLNFSKEMRDIGHLNFAKIKGFFEVRKKIAQSIKESKLDLVYFVPATSSLGFIRDYLFWKQIRKYYLGKIIFHIRSRVLNKDWNNVSFRKRFTNMLNYQKVIVLGKELVPDIHEIIPEKNIFILPNAIKNEISEEEFKKIISERKKRNSLNILFLSNLDFSKGWPKLLESCRILKNRNFDFKCNFVGEFPGQKEKRFFFNFVNKNNLENNVFYLGKKTGSEKNKILMGSDVLVFPTEYPLETFGRVILEGMMFGLPVIANGIATIPSIIDDGKTGFVLKENSPKEISEKIILFQDNKIREKFGKEGRKKFIKNYELNNYRKKFIKIIESS